jgi:hypothetical protein
MWLLVNALARIYTMASNKQLEANKANAKRSTGPRTQGGKARSRLNSRKHGLTAKTLIIVGECADDFEQLRADLMDKHDPQSALECELVERIAGILWRFRRVPFFEAAILGARHAEAQDIPLNWQASRELPEEEVENWEAAVRLGEALIEDARSHDALGKLARHETTLMNALRKTLDMLLLLQEKRRNKKDEPVILEAVALSPAA